MRERGGEREKESASGLSVLLQRLYRDPRYLLIGTVERFGRERISFVEACTIVSASGEIRGQALLNAEYELAGRPDGERPYGEESLLDHLLKSRGAGGAALDEEDLAALREESWQYYVRRGFLFLLGRWAAARDDAEHNLGIWSLVEQAEVSEEAKWTYLRWWPWIERDRAIGQALWELERGEPEEAATELYRAGRAIAQFGRRWAEQYEREGREGAELCSQMGEHVAAVVEVLRRERGLPVSLEERLEAAERRGDVEEVERLRAELIRRAMEEEG